MCAHSRHTFYYWQQSFDKASFYGGIRLKSRSLRGTKRKSPFSVEWEWSSVIISRCRLASPGASLWSLMKQHPLFLLLLTHATFTFKNKANVLDAMWGPPLNAIRPTDTTQAQNYIKARTDCLDYLIVSVRRESTWNFDVFTAGVINHKTPIKCELVPCFFFYNKAVWVQRS